ncbi:dUTP diphosphatase [Natronincola ferrireducens]|uniref:Dimeric dUTPase, all-alpha-NTP-PPase (MazG) superfamily n=1 Tax=Natronincola ferrireducens TaxID=393762 RepID=A0A1G9BJA1_9FIRM|nr:dUTP diphosphatase [Natronincola ferrireducens]SDK39598.1 Dimeric dUTPase, all-alpha-NTP-PPase (MazG) superfamily [Natronincola ferrireducens]
MDLQHLFKIQSIIENSIMQISDIKEDALGKENVFDLRFLALQIKTGEIANLTKCYKYSKEQESIPKDKLFVRYLDAMKFLLSIGNVHEFNIIDKYAIEALEREENIIKLFSSIYDGISNLKEEILQNNYIGALSIYTKLFAKYVNLGEVLGLSFDEVYAYYTKNYMAS